MIKDRSEFNFGTKSETLIQLQPLLSHSKILPIFCFSECDWQIESHQILTSIRSFSPENRVIIRSSAKNEDGHENSMAGAFQSCLNVSVKDEAALKTAIEQVIGSFGEFSQTDNQILVQPMLTNINMSGVLMTHDLESGAPYYIVNYDDESGLTDTITGGVGIQKTVFIYRKTELDKVNSPRIRSLLIACKEIESICDNVPLDIEFAIDQAGGVYIFQVRRITSFKKWHPVTERRVARTLQHVAEYISQIMKRKSGIYGDKTILGVMPDWNPAEIIGTTPRPLASSLYRYLITQSIWRKSRSEMGYFHPKNQELMLLIDYHPYIDVRASFNSFLPQKLSTDIKEKLLNAWIARLDTFSEFHDKVEFEVVQTCIDFTFNQDFDSRYKGLLNKAERDEYRLSLQTITLEALLMQKNGTFHKANNIIKHLADKQCIRTLSSTSDLSSVRDLLLSCRDEGAYAFAILARHAFIAESLLRSAVKRGALSAERQQMFKQSIHTITTDLADEYVDVSENKDNGCDFLLKFGHLRPGTYDITSLRYDERNDLFTDSVKKKVLTQNASFTLTPNEQQKLQLLLKEADFSIGVEQLLEYMRKAIKAREYAKFVFTRDLSDALAVLTEWGGKVGLSRDDLSYLDIFQLLDALTNPLLDEVDRVLLDKVGDAKRNCEQARSLKLGHLITNQNDIFVIPIHRSSANFITAEAVESDVVVLNLDTPATKDLSNKIVCIENADPGYDWLFTKGIAGLITQYGGTNSHMAIRCVEFDIPAAIGCGEQLFSRVSKSQRLILNCRDNKIEMF